MITSTIDYLRRNAIALTALGFALLALAGGTYAAVSLPRGSVGPQQLNHKLIGGYVRAWATVNANLGVMLGSSGGARVLSRPPAGPLRIAWPGKFPRSQRACTAVATAAAQPAASPLIAFYEGRGRVSITTANGIFPSGISIAVIC